MGAFEKLMGYSSGLGAKKVEPVADTTGLSIIDKDYGASTPLGYFLQTLHKLGYLIVEPTYTSDSGEVVTEFEYVHLEDEDKKRFTMGYQYTELAKMLLSDGDNLVIAGAGSGKTTSLVFRIMKDILTGEATKLVDVGGQQVSVVDSIFVGTFLKSGADELKEAVETWQRKLGYIVTTDRMQFGTLHAEFKRALNALGVKTPIGTAESIRKCLKSAIDLLGITRSDGGALSFDDYTSIESIVTYYRNKLGVSKYQHPACQEYCLLPDVLDKLVQLFSQERARAGIMDFEDLQELLYRYLYVTPNKAIQDFIANRYRYIYLDEFQDTSEIQYAIIKFYARGRLYLNGAETAPDKGELFEGLYTGEKTKGKIIAIGDDDQCLLRGTPVITKEGIKPIEDIKAGEYVLSGVGNSKSDFNIVESVSKKAFARDVYTVKTSSGKCFTSTDNHTCFARVPEIEHGVYLTYSLTEGFNLSFEPAERSWLLKKCNNFEEARDYYEDYLQFYNMDITSSSVIRAQGAIKLLNAEGLDMHFAHMVDRDATRGVNFVCMFEDGSNTVARFNYVDDKGTVKHSVKQGSIDDIFGKAKSLAFNSMTVGNNYTHYEVKFNENVYSFVPASSLKRGMYVPVVSPDGSVTEEEVVSIERKRFVGDVFDINVSNVRNFAAGGILVHNCIYSWRGSSIEVMCDEFPKDFKPTVLNISRNYRCPSNILEPVVTSIEENSKRYPKDLKSSREGGEFNAYHFLGITPMLDHLKEQIDEDMKNGLSIAIICRTNFDGVIPAFLLEMDHKYTFSVSSEAMTLNSALPRSILNVSRLFTDRSSQYIKSTLDMLVPYSERFGVKKLCDRLKSDASIGVRSSIWTLDERDICYTCMSLIKPIRTMKTFLFDAEGNKIPGGDIKALKWLYCYLISSVYDGDSAYALRVRSYIESVLYLLKTKNFSSASEFLDEVSEYSDRLKARVKKKNAKISIVTVHEFKGKERDSVYVWHDSENFFPANKTDLLNRNQVEEERRVHYIACTRAKKKCTVYALRNSHGMFLDEMDCKISDPTVIKGSLTKISEVDVSKSCSVEEDKLKQNLNGFSFSDDKMNGDKNSDNKNVEIAEIPNVSNTANE